MEVLKIEDWLKSQEKSQALKKYMEDWANLILIQSQHKQDGRRSAVIGHVNKGGGTYDVQFILPPGL